MKSQDKPKLAYATNEQKLKLAKKLYKDNPSKVFADGVKRAQSNLAKEKITPIKPVVKFVSDNTKVVKPVIKEIIKSRFLKAKKK
jgi:hypothetical protein